MNKEDLFKDIKAVIFDLDGTLIDSLELWNKIDIEFFKMHNREVPLDYSQKIAHMNFMEMAVFTHSEYGFKETPEEIAKIWTDMSLQAYAKDIKTKPYVKEFLEKLKKANYKIGLVTTSKYSHYEPCLKNNGIWNCFDSDLDVNQINSSKKEPTCYKLMASKLGSDIEHTIVFEDILQAITTAKNAGFRLVAVEDKANKKDEDKIKKLSDYYLSSYKELLDLNI